jgi:hypothetical protein
MRISLPDCDAWRKLIATPAVFRTLPEPVVGARDFEKTSVAFPGEDIMKLHCGRILAVLVCFALTQACRGGDSPYQDLLQRLPDSTNVITVANVAGLHKALGLAPGASISSGDLSSIPHKTSQFVMGAQIDLSQRSHLWSLALVKMEGKISIDDIATLEESPAEKLGNYSMVASPRNCYFVELAPNLLAVRTPADRQQLKRWLMFQKNNASPALSPYLQQAVKADDSALMVLAIDLTDNLDPSAIRRGLNRSEVMKSHKKADYDAAGKSIASIQGMTLTVRAGSPLEGELVVSFGQEIKPFRFFAKSLWFEILKKTGLFISDFEEWRSEVGEESVKISGTLSLNGLRKIGALIKTPAPNDAAGDMAAYSSQSPGQRTLAASLSYFKKVTQLLSDLKVDKAKTEKDQAGWYDQFAEQIDKLPTLNVDPELVGFAAATSQHLRAMSTTLNGVSIQNSYLQAVKNSYRVGYAPLGTYSYSAYNGYYYAGSNYTGTAMQANQQQAGNQAQGAQDRQKLWESIDNETAEVRRQMTQKFMTQF